MTTNQIPRKSPKRRADEIQVVSIIEVAPHTFEVITESERYGRVTQTVLMLPDAVAPPFDEPIPGLNGSNALPKK